MSKIYEAAYAITDVEEAMCELKPTLCDGSMIKGYTAKKEVDLKAVKNAFVLVELRMEALRRKIEALSC